MTTTTAKCRHCHIDITTNSEFGWVASSGMADAGGAWNYCVESPAFSVDDRGHRS